MAVQQQVQEPQEQNRKRPLWVNMVAAFIILVLLVLVAGATVVILGLLGVIHVPWYNNVSVILLTVIIPVLGAMIPLLQWILSLPFGKPEQAPTPQLIVQIPPTPSMPPPLPPPDKPAFRGIVGLPPPTNPRTIQQREKTVKEIYKKLTEPDITAIALTGIAGIGKSTLAALVYNYAEQQRRAGNGPFTADAIWLGIDRTVTMVDLAGNIFESLGKPIPGLTGMSPQNQAITLFNGLNMVDRPRVVILNQFEDLLDWQTWRALPDRPGIGEWLDAINSQQCSCRILLTSRPYPQGAHDYPPIYMQEYRIDGLDEAEGVELLRKRGVQATEAELRTAVERSGGHAFSLSLLASLLQRRDLTLIALLQDPVYTQFWTGDIARNLLDTLYTQQMDQAQRKLLAAFSVYREPVSLDAVEAVIDDSTGLATSQIEAALDALLAQHVLQTSGEGRYRLHTIVVDYAQSHFTLDGNEQGNREAIRAAHGRAAEYYEQRAAKLCPPPGKRLQIKDVHELIEAIWHYCQAQQWQKAYDLMNQEGIFKDLRRLGGNAILLELYQLLPLDQWHPQRSEMADVYDKLGQVSRVLGRIQQAQGYYEQALAIRRDLGDRLGEGETLNNLGRVYADLGRREEALVHFEQALNVMREMGNQKGEGRTRNQIGKIYLDLGRNEEALMQFEQALPLRVKGEDRLGEAATINNIGRVYYALDKKEEALTYYQQALSIQVEIRDRGGQGKTRNNLGRVYADLGKKEEALTYYRQALSIRQEIGDRGGEGLTLQNIGTLYVEQHRYDVALASFLLARNIFQEVQSPHRDEAQDCIDKLSEKIGEKQFAMLLAQVEPRSHQIVEGALQETN